MTAAPDLSDFSNEEIKEVLNEVRHPVDVAVYSVGNYFNMASMVRTAHSFLVNTFHIINIENLSKKDLFYHKGSMSTHRYENFKIWQDEDEFLEFSKANNKNIVSFERRPGDLKPKTIWDYKYPENPILLFGSEKFGVPDKLLENSKDIVCIPMFGTTNDLNLAVAFGMAVNDWTMKHYRTKVDA